MTGSFDTARLHDLVRRMAKARNHATLAYMPAALLAVHDLAEQGRVRAGVVRVADYATAFKRLMVEALPTSEDMWFRPMMHVREHAMWQPLLGGRDVEYDKRRVSSLTEKRASTVADALRLDPVLRAALADPAGRAVVRREVYEVLHADLDEHSTRLADVHEHLDANRPDSDRLRELELWEHRHEDRDAFEDLRRRELSNRVVREGQAEFRRALLAAYRERCAMSAADAPRALEAAHILPYLGAHSHRVTNGLLLRADLHRLFDDGLLTVSKRMTIELHDTLADTTYRQLHGQSLRLPPDAIHHPDRDSLDYHRRKSPPPPHRPQT